MLFIGLFWMGVKVVDFGLVDVIGSLDFVVCNVIKVLDVVDYIVKENFVLCVVCKFGMVMGVGVVKVLVVMG